MTQSPVLEPTSVGARCLDCHRLSVLRVGRDDSILWCLRCDKAFSRVCAKQMVRLIEIVKEEPECQS